MFSRKPRDRKILLNSLRDMRGIFCYNALTKIGAGGHRPRAAGKGACAMLDIQDVFSNLFGLFLLIGVGYGAVRLGVLPASASKILSRLLMNITLPATVFTSLVRPFDSDFLRSGLIAVVLAAFLYVLYGIISALLSRPLRVPAARRGMWIFSCTFNNSGFMGFPIALALFGEEGLTLAVFLGIPFNLITYTAGVKLVCMDRSASEDQPPVSWRSILISPINVSIALGLIFYLAQISIPSVISTPLTHLSNVTTPLSMMIIGMTLSGGKLLSLFRDPSVISASFMRLLFLPFVTWIILRLLPLNDSLLVGVTLIIMAMPAPAVTSILAETYGADKEFAAQAVFLSSLLCLITIPLISLLL